MFTDQGSESYIADLPEGARAGHLMKPQHAIHFLRRGSQPVVLTSSTALDQSELELEHESMAPHTPHHRHHHNSSSNKARRQRNIGPGLDSADRKLTSDEEEVTVKTLDNTTDEMHKL